MSKHWSEDQIKAHKEAAHKLGLIKDEVASLIRTNRRIVTDRMVLDFVRRSYKRYGLVNDSKKEFAIVAFGENTKHVHYFPKRKGAKLKPDTLILLDIWARLNKKSAPYADMTWMFYFGTKIPNNIQKKWKTLERARDISIALVKSRKNLRGFEVDRVAHDVIMKAGYGNAIKHTVGHSLGMMHPHGQLPGINWKEYSPIQKNVGYTIEPGMYFKNFGIRTEIDFYISKRGKIVITTPIQKTINLL